MSVQIVLSAYDITASLHREFIQQEMAGSILAQALQDDPNANAITLPSPEVTPPVLQTLVNLSQGKDPEASSPDFLRADRYLNWPLLKAFGSQHYDRLDRKDINGSTNRDILEVALEDDWSVAMYLAKKGFDFTYEHQRPIRMAVRCCDVTCIEFILGQPGVDASINDNLCLDIAIENSNLVVTRVLRQIPKIASTYDLGLVLDSAVKDSGLPEMIREVASWPDPEDASRQCRTDHCDMVMTWAILHNEDVVAGQVLKMHNYIPTRRDVRLCCEYGRGQILKM